MRYTDTHREGISVKQKLRVKKYLLHHEWKGRIRKTHKNRERIYFVINLKMKSYEKK